MLKEKITLVNKIFEIRETEVILDSDLAIIFGVETKRINEAVSRNKEKFPDRYCFRLTDEESSFLVANCDQKKEKRGGKYKNPRVFTEHGVTMIATILKSKRAISESIKIIDAFVSMRKYLSTSLEQKYINELVLKDSKRIDLLEDVFSGFKEKRNHLFFKNQVYDAYSLMKDIFDKSKKEIIIIDNYIDKNILDILRKIDKQITIYTNMYNNDDYKKSVEEYSNIKLIIRNDIHDRFIIIDRKILYHCGSSFKDLGKKCFAISLIEYKKILGSLLEELNISEKEL